MTCRLVTDLRDWAHDEPHAIAVASPLGSLTVGELAARVLDRSGALVGAGIKTGSVVAVSADGPDEIVAFLSVLAAGSIPVSTPSETEFLATQTPLLVHVGRRWAPDSALSLHDVRALRKAPSDWSHSGDGTVGILTSGTTGEPKLLLVDDDIIAARLNGYFDWWPTRSFLNLFRLSSVAGFFALAAALRSREVYHSVAVIDEAAVAFCATANIAHLAGSPHHIQTLVSAARAVNQQLSFESVTTAGAPQTPPFIATVAPMCSGPIHSIYGSTEAGGVARTSPTAGAGEFRGEIGRGAIFETVDDDNNPLPVGSEGRLRYRAPGLATSYRVGEDLVPVSKDGWFYPGDRGHITDNGDVVVRGRDGDVVNVGGVKVNPVPFENLAGTVEGVKDAACAAVTFPDGSLHLVLAVIARDDDAYRDVVTVFRDQPTDNRPNIVVAVPSIPRNRAGKLMRDELSDKLTSAIRVNPEKA